MEQIVSINRPEGGSVQGVQRGMRVEEGDQSGNRENMGEREKVCMDVDKGRGRNSNCLLRSLLFCCTGLHVFYAPTKRSSVCVCV